MTDNTNLEDELFADDLNLKGTILFSKQNKKSFLYTLDLETNKAKKVSHLVGQFLHPNEKFICEKFTFYNRPLSKSNSITGSTTIYTVDKEGFTNKSLDLEVFGKCIPSPTEQKMVISSDDTKGGRVSYLYSYNGRIIDQIQEKMPLRGDGHPQWTCDGKGFFYLERKTDERNTVYYYDIKSGTKEQISDENLSFIKSLNEHSVLGFHSWTECSIFDQSGRSKFIDFPIHDDDFMHGQHFTSPKGTYIAILKKSRSNNPEKENFSIYDIESQEEICSNKPWTEPMMYWGADYLKCTWSPDEKMIAIYNLKEKELFIQNIHSNEIVKINIPSNIPLVKGERLNYFQWKY